MKDELRNIRNEFVALATDAKGSEELEELRASYLGKNGKLAKLVKRIKDLSSDERKEVGVLINDVKNTINEALEDQLRNFDDEPDDIGKIDVTIPVSSQHVGKYHPTTIVINEMLDIFKHLGFSVVEGPEIESDEYNFERLNLPKDHPARSLQDALYIEEPEVVLRTHTSSVESRMLANKKPPYRVVVAGKCYRYENVNASNNAMFYQFQGVALQKGLSMADLKGTLFYFAKRFFGEERKVRFRCKYYPEVEPGAGLDLDCQFCKGKGCSVCKGRGWIEMLGCGMIHPNMLKTAGINPQEISGFAFGMGLDRIVMDRFKIGDIRSLYNSDIKYQ